ncbi:FixH family protein [Pallidibacillus pasinlerensis]|uniref:FixH family protein n=1 Tax=Pallidibacillus pasinlerensis TaxID=2703818 RepID=A0ABX0ABV1_9BACI|nr:FixH family protein [Pallidibacillus pasinlerensis]NCU18547.1 FixH family protein [Pallidibacillus pasinlerensis]
MYVKNLRAVVLLIFVVFLISGCDQKQEVSSSTGDAEENIDEMPEPLNVELILPEKAALGESIEIKAHVTQGEENVDDAYEVVFEIWVENDKENSEMIDYTEYRDGIYSIKKVFEEPGVYHVQSHVTARGMHIMPTKQVIVEEE